jgi:hypothetical protein
MVRNSAVDHVSFTYLAKEELYCVNIKRELGIMYQISLTPFDDGCTFEMVDDGSGEESDFFANAEQILTNDPHLEDTLAFKDFSKKDTTLEILYSIRKLQNETKDHNSKVDTTLEYFKSRLDHLENRTNKYRDLKGFKLIQNLGIKYSIIIILTILIMNQWIYTPISRPLIQIIQDSFDNND